MQNCEAYYYSDNFIFEIPIDKIIYVDATFNYDKATITKRSGRIGSLTLKNDDYYSKITRAEYNQYANVTYELSNQAPIRVQAGYPYDVYKISSIIAGKLYTSYLKTSMKINKSNIE